MTDRDTRGGSLAGPVKMTPGIYLLLMAFLFFILSIPAAAESASPQGEPVLPAAEKGYPEQSEPASPTLVTLEECLRLAKEKSVELESAVISQKIAELNVANAKAGYRPQVEVGVDYAIDNEKWIDLGSERFKVFLTLTQNIFNNSENASQLKDAAVSLLSTELSLEKIRQDLLLSIAEGYFALLAAQKHLEREQSTVEKSSRSYREAVTRYRDGLVAEIEVLQAETALSSNELKLQTHKNDLEEIALRLSQSMEMPAGTTMRVVDVDSPAFFDIELETCQKIAVEKNIELKIQEKALEKLRAFQKGIRRAHWPSLALSAFMGQDPDSPYDPEADAGILLTLKKTLYDGGITRRRIKQADLELRKQEGVIRLLKRNLLRAIELHHYSLKHKIKAFLKAEKRRNLARRLSKLTRRSYELGVIPLKEYLDTHDETEQAEIAYTAALAKYFLAEYRLKLKMGLDPADTISLPGDHTKPITAVDTPAKTTIEDKGHQD